MSLSSFICRKLYTHKVINDNKYLLEHLAQGLAYTINENYDDNVILLLIIKQAPFPAGVA